MNISTIQDTARMLWSGITWSDKECQLYLFSEGLPCQTVSNALLYILHFVFQSPHGAPCSKSWILDVLQAEQILLPLGGILS